MNDRNIGKPGDIGEPLAAALSDYMMAAFGRRPTVNEMWDIYWAAVDAIEQAATEGCKSMKVIHRHFPTSRQLCE